MPGVQKSWEVSDPSYFSISSSEKSSLHVPGREPEGGPGNGVAAPRVEVVGGKQGPRFAEPRCLPEGKWSAAWGPWGDCVCECVDVDFFSPCCVSGGGGKRPHRQRGVLNGVAQEKNEPLAEPVTLGATPSPPSDLGGQGVVGLGTGAREGHPPSARMLWEVGHAFPKKGCATTAFPGPPAPLGSPGSTSPCPSFLPSRRLCGAVL